MNYRKRRCLLLLAILALTTLNFVSNQARVAAQRLGFAPRNSFSRQTAIRQRGVGLGARSVTLQEMLEKGLKARRPEEFAFIQRIVTQVDQNTLSTPLVQSTFDWARRRQPHIPYPYFERALKIRAARLGIRVR